jgi:hypothetical protein
MIIAVWAVGLLLLGLWSLAVWALHLFWGALSSLSWAEALERLRASQLPALLEPWLGGFWEPLVASVEPWLGVLRPWLETSAGWLSGAMPVLLWLLWGLGAAVLLVLTLLGVVGLTWWRGRRTGGAAPA